jgi:hypothetical protein
LVVAETSSFVEVARITEEAAGASQRFVVIVAAEGCSVGVLSDVARELEAWGSKNCCLLLISSFLCVFFEEEEEVGP